MSTARYTLRQSVAPLLTGSGDRPMIMGTPAATFTTTGFGCVALALNENDYFNDWYLRFYVATNKDITVTVTDFVKTGGVVTFYPAVTLVDAEDLFELHHEISPDEINSAINLAIQMVEDEALVSKVDATLETVASTWEYTVPSGFYTISSIYQEQSTANKYASSDLINPRHWQIIDVAGTKKIWFDPSNVTLTAERNLRLVGQSRASQLALDATTTDIPPAYIVNQAAALLHLARASEATAGHAAQAKIFQYLADKERAKIQVAPTGWRV